MEQRSGKAGCLEWAVAIDPAPGERECGDGCAVMAKGDETVVAVVDGLGHGTSAHKASEQALLSIEEALGTPAERMRAAHQTLMRLRGAAVGVLAVQQHSGAVRWCGVGNVEAAVQDVAEPPKRWRRLFLQSGLVGHRLPALREAHARLEPGGLFVVSTDGVAPEFLESLGPTHDLDALTHRILTRYRVEADDALVFAGRFHPEAP